MGAAKYVGEQLESYMVYYPACGVHTAVACAFAEAGASEIHHMDIRESAIRNIESSKELIEKISERIGKRVRIQASVGDAKENKEKYDVVVILNQDVNAKVFVDNVKEGGYVISNNYHDGSVEIHESKLFEPKIVFFHTTVEIGDEIFWSAEIKEIRTRAERDFWGEERKVIDVKVGNRWIKLNDDDIIVFKRK